MAVRPAGAKTAFVLRGLTNKKSYAPFGEVLGTWPVRTNDRSSA
jgi:hypothetical protein